MRLIIDTNRIISALLTKGWTREIIMSDAFDFFTLDYVMEELRTYKEYVLKKAHMNEKEFELLFTLIMETITIVPERKIKRYLKKAIDIMNDIDRDDAPILACAFAIPNEGIWTEDKDFDKQLHIKIWKTKELKMYLGN